MHTAYDELAGKYTRQKMLHGLASLFELDNISPKKIGKTEMESILNKIFGNEKMDSRKRSMNRELKITSIHLGNWYMILKPK